MELSPETPHLPPSIKTARHGNVLLAALGFTVIGAIFGPVLGVWLSMVAVNNAPAGIAATLMSLSPVFILPLAVLVEKEKLTIRAWMGAVVAVIGVCMLSWPSVMANSGQSSDSGAMTQPDDEPSNTLSVTED